MSTLSKGKVAALLLKLSLADASLRVDNGQLKVRGWQLLSTDLQQEIKEHKDAIIKYLSHRETLLAEAQTDDEEEAADTATAPPTDSNKPKLDRHGHLLPISEPQETLKRVTLNRYYFRKKIGTASSVAESIQQLNESLRNPPITIDWT